MRPFLTEPYLLSLCPATEMNILWLQSAPDIGWIEYGLSPDLGKTAQAVCYEMVGLRLPGENGYQDNPEYNPPLPLWQCIVSLTELLPGERIFYRCHVGDSSTQIYDFHTAPEAGTPFRFAQLSDLQAIPTCDTTVYQVGLQHPDFLLYSGDAAVYAWRADHWLDLGPAYQDQDARKRGFFPCLQQQNGARLLQYCPVFVCPGNHELDDMRYSTDKVFAAEDRHWSWSIFMQMFRPLYPETDYTLTWKRWYSVDYSDLHITSLSLQRFAFWPAHEAPGWRLVDDICLGSPQYQWLAQDLETSQTRFKWVIQHWHILNKGEDVQPHLCQPVDTGNGAVSYPYNYEEELMKLFERGGVHAVSYGHSHVYERYYYRHAH